MLSLDEKFVNAFTINNLEEQAYSHVLEREKFYKCKSCDSVYAEMDLGQAQECCETETVFTYKCPVCKHHHLKARLAVMCCGADYAEIVEDEFQEFCEPETVYAYKCPTCREIHIRAASAVSCCCADVDEGKIPEGISYQLNQLYLENANQIRLF